MAIGLYGVRAIGGHPGLHRAIRGYTGLYGLVRGYTGLYRSVQGWRQGIQIAQPAIVSGEEARDRLLRRRVGSGFGYLQGYTGFGYLQGYLKSGVCSPSS